MVIAQPLPMRFRLPRPNEALAGYISECAKRYSVHPASLLEHALCPRSLQRSSFLPSEAGQKLAAVLGQDATEILTKVYPSVPGSADIPLVSFHGTSLRRSHILVSKRRLSPAGMRKSAHIRELSMIKPIEFCTETWTALTDRCLSCGVTLTWHAVDHLALCHSCGADQRDFDTPEVDDDLIGRLQHWTGLIHPVKERRAAAKGSLPADLQHLDSGIIFDLVLGLSGLLKPSYVPPFSFRDHDLEAIAQAMEIVLSWPDGLISALEEDTSLADDDRKSLSTRLRRYAQLPSTLPEIQALILRDLAADRRCDIGLIAERRALRESVGGLSVRQAALRIGIAPTDIVLLRRAGVLKDRTVGHGKIQERVLTGDLCEGVRQDLDNKMPLSEFTKSTGLSEHAVEELASAGHFEFRQNAALNSLYKSRMIDRETAETFISKFRGSVTPLGDDDGDYVPLPRIFEAIGGRPKPYSDFFDRVFSGEAVIKCPMNAENQFDLAEHRVSPAILTQLEVLND